MKRKCELCGGLFNEFDMMSYNTGRKVVWLCWECHKNSQYEANKSDLVRQKKLYQIHKFKKRNR